MGNLIVSDSEYNALNQHYQNFGALAEQQLDTYFSIMQKVCASAIPSGAVYQNLVSFVSEGQKLRGQISDITKTAAADCQNYITKIDEKDQYLY
ncbi:MAG: hypothetical protein Q4G07_10625 [Oscillospiraceae bacterium]|nr:hypothetical protein [Oscillospiraceae bacterium]